jgi:outer membrane immunogenic protein
MKKLVLALTGIAAFTGSAIAADLPARTYSKAPAPVAYAPSWTGCYVGGGGGYGMWNQENTVFDTTTVPRIQDGATTTAGGRGYFGTVQAGCDYQFALGSFNVVIGGFGDYDFSSLKGNTDLAGTGSFGREKMSSSWSAGGRAGVLVTPSLLTYFSAGYTESTFDRYDLLSDGTFAAIGLPSGFYVGKRTYNGYFIGAGDEYALSFLPGLFWKTEYRFSDLNTKTNSFFDTTTNLPSLEANMDSHKFVHTVRSELTYHFNWGGPVAAKY